MAVTTVCAHTELLLSTGVGNESVQVTCLLSVIKSTADPPEGHRLEADSLPPALRTWGEAAGVSGPCQHGRFLSGGHGGTRRGQRVSPPAGSRELWPPRDKGRPGLSHKAPPPPQPVHPFLHLPQAAAGRIHVPSAWPLNQGYVAGQGQPRVSRGPSGWVAVGRSRWGPTPRTGGCGEWTGGLQSQWGAGGMNHNSRPSQNAFPEGKTWCPWKVACVGRRVGFGPEKSSWVGKRHPSLFARRVQGRPGAVPVRRLLGDRVLVSGARWGSVSMLKGRHRGDRPARPSGCTQELVQNATRRRLDSARK